MIKKLNKKYMVKKLLRFNRAKLNQSKYTDFRCPDKTVSFVWEAR